MQALTPQQRRLIHKILYPRGMMVSPSAYRSPALLQQICFPGFLRASLPINYYVDPSIDANSGTGTPGDPFGDLQYALDTVPFGLFTGVQMNIVGGTDEVLTAPLNLTGYGTPSLGMPLIFRGCTATANDGGQGGIDGNGGAIIDSAFDHIHFIDLHIHNSGASGLISFDEYCSVQRCHLENASVGVIFSGKWGYAAENHFEDISAEGIITLIGQWLKVIGNYFKNGSSKKFTRCISTNNRTTLSILRNYFSLDGSSTAMYQIGSNSKIMFNSILSNAGTGKGINTSSSAIDMVVLANLVEGFSGVGGKGIDLNNATHPYTVFAFNGAYNNTTNYSGLGDAEGIMSDDNESLSSSPFSKLGDDTFANRHIYFGPANVGNVRDGVFGAI